MLITIDTQDRRPIYRQVADEIKTLLARGALVEGEVLPSVRRLAHGLAINLAQTATYLWLGYFAGLVALAAWQTAG